MASGAVVQNAGVIKLCSGKNGGVMAYRTVFCGGDVADVFDRSNGDRAVVTGSAIIDNANMVKYRRGKSTNDVADAAILCSGDMTGIFLGDGACTVVAMTIRAAINDARMVKHAISEVGSDAVAQSAIFCCDEVIRRYAERASGVNKITVMAGGAITGNAGVIKYIGAEGSIGMTHTAVLARGYVVG